MKMLEICLKLVGCKSKKGLSSSSSCYLEGEYPDPTIPDRVLSLDLKPGPGLGDVWSWPGSGWVFPSQGEEPSGAGGVRTQVPFINAVTEGARLYHLWL